MSVLIVGEAFGEHEEREGRPFVGPHGGLLRGTLHRIGGDLSLYHVTNVFNERPPGNNVEHFFTKVPVEADTSWPQYKRSPKMWVRADKTHHLEELWHLIEAVQPNVIIALGATALWALTTHGSIERYRGSPTLTYRGRFKVLPTYHPAAVLRRWNIKPIFQFDLEKALRNADFPEIRRPRRIITVDPSLSDLERFWTDHVAGAPLVSVDVETKEGQITEVGFATSPFRALVIPFYDSRAASGNYWPSIDHEFRAWEFVRRVLREKPVIGQNFQYDMQYFWKTLGIPTMRFAGDTMLLHHSLQPEMNKGLGFLGSIYTEEPAWKTMRTDAETLKKED